MNYSQTKFFASRSANAGNFSQIKWVALVMILFIESLPCGYAQANLDIKYIRQVICNKSSFKQINKTAWHEIAPEGKQIGIDFLEISRAGQVITLKKYEGVYLELDIAKQAVFYIDGPKDKQRIDDIKEVKQDTPPKEKRITNVSAITKVISQEKRFVKESGQTWRQLDESGNQIGSELFEAGRDNQMITLLTLKTPTTEQITIELDLLEKRVWQEDKTGKKLIGPITNIISRDLADDPLVLRLSVAEAIRNNREVLLKYQDKYLETNAENNKVKLAIVDAEKINDHHKFKFEDSGKGGAYIKSVAKKGYLSVNSENLAEIKTGPPANREEFKINKEGEKIIIMSLSTGKQLSDFKKNGQAQFIRPAFVSYEFQIERVIANVIKVTARHDNAFDKQTQPLLEQTEFTLVTKDDKEIKPSLSWTRNGENSEGYEVFSSELRINENVPLGGFVKVRITNKNRDKNIIIGSILLRNYEQFRCNARVSPITDPNAKKIIPNEDYVNASTQMVFMQNGELQFDADVLPEKLQWIDDVANLKGEGMKNTPTTKMYGKEIFDSIVITDAEKVIFEKFIESYDGDFIKKFLNLENLKSENDIGNSSINDALNVVISQNPGINREALDNLKLELVQIVKSRNAMKSLIDSTRTFIEKKYDYMGAEIRTFKNYSDVGGTPPGPPTQIPDYTLSILAAMTSIIPGVGTAISAGITMAQNAILMASELNASIITDGQRISEKLTREGTKTRIIQAVNYIEEGAKNQKNAELAKLNAIERALLCDIVLVSKMTDLTSETLTLDEETKRKVRRAVWSALLPLKASLIGHPISTSANIPWECADTKEFKTMLEDRKRPWWDLISEKEVGSDFYSFFSQSPGFNQSPSYLNPIVGQSPDFRQSPGSEKTCDLWGWRLITKPWNFYEGDQLQQNETFKNFGELRIGNPSKSMTEYINEMFDSPLQLYHAFKSAGELFVVPKYVECSESYFVSSIVSSIKEKQLVLANREQQLVLSTIELGPVGEYDYKPFKETTLLATIKKTEGFCLKGSIAMDYQKWYFKAKPFFWRKEGKWQDDYWIDLK